MATGAIPVSWLLEGPAFVRYRTLVDLLGQDETADETQSAREQIAEEPAVQQLLDRRNPHGYWGAPHDIYTWWPKKDTTFWVLGVLADFGLRREDCGLERCCEYVLSTQLPSGAFGLRPPPKAYDCFTGILSRSLALLCYSGDERLERAYSWMLGRQRLDGGFWCKDTGQPGGPREEEASCAYGTLCVLGALSIHPTLKHSTASESGAHFLLRCWDNRDRVKYAGHDSQIGRGWEQLKYPFTDYRILHYLDTLSRLPSVCQDERLQAITSLLMSKRDLEGRLRPQSIHRAWSDFDFAQKDGASRWLTLLACRAARRVGWFGYGPAHPPALHLGHGSIERGSCLCHSSTSA